MHKLYNQATWQVGPKPETQEIDRDRDRDGRGDKEGEVLNVAMANDALKPKTKQLPKSFRKEQERSNARWGEVGIGRQVAWLVAWPAC